MIGALWYHPANVPERATTYPERRRDRPCEASATYRKVWCQFRQTECLEDEREASQDAPSRAEGVFS